MVENYQVVSSVRGPRKANFSLGLYITIVESRILRNEKYGSISCSLHRRLFPPHPWWPAPVPSLHPRCTSPAVRSGLGGVPGRNQPRQRHTQLASEQWWVDTATVGRHAQRHNTSWLRACSLFFFFLTFRWTFWTTFIYLINFSRGVPSWFPKKKSRWPRHGGPI